MLSSDNVLNEVDGVPLVCRCNEVADYRWICGTIVAADPCRRSIEPIVVVVGPRSGAKSTVWGSRCIWAVRVVVGKRWHEFPKVVTTLRWERLAWWRTICPAIAPEEVLVRVKDWWIARSVVI